MAAFLDDRPLVAGVNENWDDIYTYEQVKRPDSDISPITMKTMHHLPQIFFDTLRPERPDCPVLIPNTFSMARDRLIAQDLYSYAPCGLPTGDFMPAEQAQIRLMTTSPVMQSSAPLFQRLHNYLIMNIHVHDLLYIFVFSLFVYKGLHDL